MTRGKLHTQPFIHHPAGASRVVLMIYKRKNGSTIPFGGPQFLQRKRRQGPFPQAIEARITEMERDRRSRGRYGKEKALFRLAIGHRAQR